MAGCDCGDGSDADGTDAGNRDSAVVGECVDDDDCPSGESCHPTEMRCVTLGDPCTAQSECTDGRFCDSDLERCLEGVPGSPCETDDNCTDLCREGVCGCDGLAQEQELVGEPLDVYLILDRTGSMGDDCDYVYGDSPPTSSKACSATYAVSDYVIDVEPMVDTRLAFHFMSQPDDCDGSPYLTPLVGLTSLPVTEDHAIVQEIDAESFSGGLGTHIEGALRGLAGFTVANQTDGREMIGVLVTDGDPNGCEEDVAALRMIIADHLAATGIKTFIIGMEGATEENLEELAMAGGAEPHDDYCGSIDPPCHYWNVGDGSGDAIASALTAILAMAAPLPCEFDVIDLEAPPGETLDYGQVNVTLTVDGETTTIGQVPSEADCPGDRPAWYYDDPATPTQIFMCPNACDLVSGTASGARVDIVVGCQDTVVLI